MIRRLSLGTLALVCLLGGMVTFALAAEEKKAAEPTEAQKQAMMEAWMKVATPGQGHKLLEPTVGTFNVKTVMCEAPGAPPQESAAVSENTWVLGGRFVQQKFKGTYAGMPYEGLGFTGYDNYKKQYVGVWMDTMGTMMMVMTGTMDQSGKVMTAEGTFDDVMTAKPMKLRSVTRIIDANKHVMEMYGPDLSGKEFKMMEMTYTRQ